MGLFANTWAARQHQLDSVFAESIRLVPKLIGGYAASVIDPDRSERLLPAIISEAPQRQHVDENAIGRDFNPALVAARTVASIDAARLGGEWPRVGDRLVAIDRHNQPSFEITAVESDGLARVLLSLVRIDP
ncbi:hypothetical protein ACQR1K_10030 [Bradyrhizobium sp. HKCCYLRH3095]|uniref:hypothetical protein n=1 Tax=Bradyrhizobium sp. HKCCYLRH3095 TaxID=3420765 RepID=UPI003EB9D37B